jgi:DNA-binding LytR/AlgR family response regulator
MSLAIRSPTGTGACAAGSRVRVLSAESIALYWGSTIEVIRWCDVMSVHSDKNSTAIAVNGRTLSVHCSLKAVLSALAGFDLIQIRRGVAVNGSSVRRLVSRGRHRLIVVLEAGVCMQVGREFQRTIRARFGPKPSILAD